MWLSWFGVEEDLFSPGGRWEEFGFIDGAFHFVKWMEWVPVSASSTGKIIQHILKSNLSDETFVGN